MIVGTLLVEVGHIGRLKCISTLLSGNQIDFVTIFGALRLRKQGDGTLTVLEKR